MNGPAHLHSGAVARALLYPIAQRDLSQNGTLYVCGRAWECAISLVETEVGLSG